MISSLDALGLEGRLVTSESRCGNGSHGSEGRLGERGCRPESIDSTAIQVERREKKWIIFFRCGISYPSSQGVGRLVHTASTKSQNPPARLPRYHGEKITAQHIYLVE